MLRLSNPTTSNPSLDNLIDVCIPIKPALPVTRTFTLEDSDIQMVRIFGRFGQFSCTDGSDGLDNSDGRTNQTFGRFGQYRCSDGSDGQPTPRLRLTSRMVQTIQTIQTFGCSDGSDGSDGSECLSVGLSEYLL